MNHNDELIDELRVRREALSAALILVQDAKAEFDRRKRDVADVRAAIEEVLLEIETGDSSRPILDAARAAENGDAPRSGLDLVTSKPAGNGEKTSV